MVLAPLLVLAPGEVPAPGVFNVPGVVTVFELALFGIVFGFMPGAAPLC